MPMRIINLNGGGGPAPAPGGASDSGLYKFLAANDFTNVNPDQNKYVEIWEEGNKSKPKPDSITVMMWGQPCWHNSATTLSPPDCGSAFGIVTLKGDDVPEKIYGFRGSHQPYPYTYNKSNTFGFNKTASREDGWLLPNMCGQNYFTNTDYIAPDAVGHHWGDFDAVYNGGNGHFFGITPSTGTDIDSPGSNGSPFGNGKRSNTTYPASCGGSGTATGRGPKAKGIGLDILKPLGGLRPHALELEPPTPRLNYDGGNGGFEFVLPTGSFGMARGVPYVPDTSVVRVAGGPIPRNRLYPNNAITYTPFLYILFEYAK